MFQIGFAAARRGGTDWRVIAHLMVASTLVFGLSSCSDDDDGGGTDPTITNEDQIGESLGGLAGVGTAALAGPEASVLQHSAVVGLMEGMHLSLPDIGGIGMARSGSEIKTSVAQLLPRPVGLATGLDDDFYGTYVRDQEDETEPFPGWVLETANDPDDGLIFQFPADPNDVYYIDPDTGAVVAIGGEIRFLNINDDFDPENPESEITSMEFELALAETGQQLQTVARVAYDITYGPTGDPIRLTIGDREDVLDSFIGDLHFLIAYDAIFTDLSFLVWIVDTSTNPDYVVRATIDVDDYNPFTEMPEQVDIDFSYGATNNHSAPAWSLIVRLDEFREDPQDPDEFDADVSGSFSHQDQAMATFSGDTTDVTVNADINGDGEVDENDTCINIDIAFPDAEGGNICVVFLELASELPVGGIGALITGDYCACGR